MKLTPREPTPDTLLAVKEAVFKHREWWLSNDEAISAINAMHEAAPSGWQPIETAPDSGFFMVYEDGAYRLRLRHDGKWRDTAYAGIECAPWGDVAVGQDAQRILDMRGTPGTYKLVVRDGCCENPTHWMPLPAPPSEQTQAAPSVPSVERELLEDLRFQLLAAANYIDALGGDSKSYRAAIARAKGE